jgi:hypothetical protein
MEYVTKDKLSRVLAIARKENELHWQLILTAFYFGPAGVRRCRGRPNKGQAAEA